MTAISSAIQIDRSSERETGECSRWGRECMSCLTASIVNSDGYNLHCSHQKTTHQVLLARCVGQRPPQGVQEKNRVQARNAQARKESQNRGRESETRSPRANGASRLLSRIGELHGRFY